MSVQVAGLTEAEARRRAAAGLANQAREHRSRSYRDILVANFFNRFNAMLGVLLVITLWLGPIQDATFGLVLIANLAIGLVQEVRAKRVLDRLEVITATRARVVRDGAVREVAAPAVVKGDAVVVSRGDQVVADGRVLEADGLEVDESLLTGESDPVAKPAGQPVRSGSFVVAGSGVFEASEVGTASYGAVLAAEARRFKRAPSELRKGTNQVLRVIGWAMPLAAVMLLVSQFHAHASAIDAARAAVAGMVMLVPEGLILLTSLAFATAVVRLASRGILVQELVAIETLARVDVVCMDKTGTLTEGGMSLAGVRCLAPQMEVDAALGAIAATEPAPNAVLAAIAAARRPGDGWVATSTVSFSSARRWSAASFEGRGTWVLGAPEAIVPKGSQPAWADAVAAAGAMAREGYRVLALGFTSGRVAADAPLPPGLTPAALVSFEERVRPQAAPMIEYFRREGIEMRILSGDSDLTVAAVARKLGIDAAAVRGRVSPAEKRQVIKDLQAAGHLVAMAGDGVNDVPALKQADVAIALASGSAASRAISQFILMRSDFDSLPEAVADGRRVIGNMERLGRLFVTKTAYAFTFSLVVGVLALPFPLLLRQLTLATMFSLGLPSFFLALEPNMARARPGFARRTVRFAVPAGVTIGLVTIAVFALSTWFLDVTLAQGRTIAVLALGGDSFWVLWIVARPLTTARRVVLAGCAAASLAALAVPQVRGFFAISPLPGWSWIGVPAAIVAGGLMLELTARISITHGGIRAGRWSIGWRGGRLRPVEGR